MTQPNRLNPDPERDALDLVMPEDIDEEWVQLFTLGVAFSGLRLMIYTNYYFFDENRSRGPKSLARRGVSGSDERGTVVDGELMGALILPVRRPELEEDEDELCIEEVPHVILSDAIDGHSGQQISTFKEERIYVPFTSQPPGSRLTVY